MGLLFYTGLLGKVTQRCEESWCMHRGRAFQIQGTTTVKAPRQEYPWNVLETARRPVIILPIAMRARYNYHHPPDEAHEAQRSLFVKGHRRSKCRGQASNNPPSQQSVQGLLCSELPRGETEWEKTRKVFRDRDLIPSGWLCDLRLYIPR